MATFCAVTVSYAALQQEQKKQFPFSRGDRWISTIIACCYISMMSGEILAKFSRWARSSTMTSRVVH